MRKCEKCGTVMRADLRLKVNGGGYAIVVDVDEKQKTTNGASPGEFLRQNRRNARQGGYSADDHS